MVFQESIKVSTKSHGEMRDPAAQVESIVTRSGIKTGTVKVSVIGSTAAVSKIEFEPGLKRDLPELLDHVIPPGGMYGHEQAWHDGKGIFEYMSGYHCSCCEGGKQ